MLYIPIATILTASSGALQDAMLRQLQQQIVALQEQLAAMSSAASAARPTSASEEHERDQVCWIVGGF